jgi:hypothetical protein
VSSCEVEAALESLIETGLGRAVRDWMADHNGQAQAAPSRLRVKPRRTTMSAVRRLFV